MSALQTTFFNSGSGDYSTQADRRVSSPAKWAPRWFACAETPTYYTTPASGKADGRLNIFDAWYRGSISLMEEELFRWAANLTQINFFPPTSLPRKGFYSDNHLGVDNYSLNLSQLSSNHVYGSIELLTTDSFLYPTWKPCACLKDSTIRFRNLSLVEASVTVGSGQVLDLTTITEYSDRILDSPVFIANYYGDIICVEPDEVIAYAGLIPIQTSGPFKVRFETNFLFNSVVSGRAIDINGRRVEPVVDYYKNIIDDYAAILKLDRKLDEDNISLKNRCQNVSISKTTPQLLSASLGLSTPFIWDTGFQTTVFVSGSADINIPGFEKYKQITENPPFYENKLILTNFPIGTVTLFLDGVNIIDPRSYSVSGNAVTLYTSELQSIAGVNSTNSRVLARYRTQQYDFSTTTASGGATYISDINVEGQSLKLGIIPTGVTVTEIPETDIEFRWNRGGRSNYGLGTFGGYYTETL